MSLHTGHSIDAEVGVVPVICLPKAISKNKKLIPVTGPLWVFVETFHRGEINFSSNDSLQSLWSLSCSHYTPALITVHHSVFPCPDSVVALKCS